jgi:hypothetical protein
MVTLSIRRVTFAAAAALAGCAMLPDWMPGSGAVRVSLSGAEQVPPVETAASGSGTFRVASDGAIRGSVTTTGMPGTLAHIHQAPRGRNGPPIIPLAKRGDTYSVPRGRKLTEAQMKAFREGGLYVNIRSSRHKGGELRAQLQL